MQGDITITEAERKRLLHAYETLMFAVKRLDAERPLIRAAWRDVCYILNVASLKIDLHDGGEWAANDDLKFDGHWETLR